MEKLICFWKGYIKIQVRGEQTERFSRISAGEEKSASEIFAVILMES